VAQGVGPEFKPQTAKKEKERLLIIKVNLTKKCAVDLIGPTAV
jgi:hypothetical protein